MASRYRRLVVVRERVKKELLEAAVIVYGKRGCNRKIRQRGTAFWKDAFEDLWAETRVAFLKKQGMTEQ